MNEFFIKGLLYGLAFSESILKEERFFNPSKQVKIWFKDGSKLTFAINRGICHTYGDFVATLTQQDECNLFDIVSSWVTQEQETKILNLGFTNINELYEVRLTLPELIRVIDELGEIDYEITQQEWLKLFLKNYYKK